MWTPRLFNLVKRRSSSADVACLGFAFCRTHHIIDVSCGDKHTVFLTSKLFHVLSLMLSQYGLLQNLVVVTKISYPQNKIRIYIFVERYWGEMKTIFFLYGPGKGTALFVCYLLALGVAD